MRPDAELFFITGADALAQIVGWRDTARLFDLAHFVGVTRPGYQFADLPAGLPPESVSLVEIPALAISSTDCRDRVRRGMPVWYLVPDGVVQYIEKSGLYRDGLLPVRPGQLLPGTAVRHLGAPASTHASPPGPVRGPDTPELQEIPR